MEPFHKFYNAILPLLKEHYRARNGLTNIDLIAGKLALKCADIYKQSIFKDKFNLDVDLSESYPFDVPGEKSILQDYTPCEICGNVRVTHLCHIIPRALGGNNGSDNLLILCANHHHLFDRHLLTKEEWDTIKWDEKSAQAREHAIQVRYRHHIMSWKYNYPFIPSCECGSQDFSVYYTETKPSIREGGVESFPGEVTKHLTCKVCGEGYCDSKWKDAEYKWWIDWLRMKSVESTREGQNQSL